MDSPVVVFGLMDSLFSRPMFDGFVFDFAVADVTAEVKTPDSLRPRMIAYKDKALAYRNMKQLS